MRGSIFSSARPLIYERIATKWDRVLDFYDLSHLNEPFILSASDINKFWSVEIVKTD